MENKVDVDIRLLTLYKQHYLDSYPNPLKCDFSCWGYYDGISVLQPQGMNTRLYKDQMPFPISELWYKTTDHTEIFQGQYSTQNIGVFCFDKDKAEKFWASYEKAVFFAVVFLQLNKDLSSIEFGHTINNKIPAFYDNAIKISCIAYNTFDNADLVVLMQGNSLAALEKLLYDIEGEPGICYTHSIMGISEKYLESCIDGVLENWENNLCHIYDKIDKIFLKVVTSGKKDTEYRLKELLNNQLTQCPEKPSFFHVAGHENLLVEIKNTAVKSLIEMLLPKGFLTHQNPLYGEYIYNIETSISVCPSGDVRIADSDPNKPNFTEQQSLSTDKNSNDLVIKKLNEWCKDKIRKYKKYLKEARTVQDESLSSYYYALLQTLNTIAQYENFKLAKDIFYLVFPAFELFDIQLQKAIERQSQSTNVMVTAEEIKDGMRNFLNSVDSIIYHTIHTAQVYLMIPGQTGAIFSIPIKLSLLYQWFIRQIIDLLNDSNKYTNKAPFKYQCLFTPELESRPTTEMISMGLPHGDRLICVKLSQRSLYMPQDLFIVLAHEIAHYVGENIRNRKQRTFKIICTISTILAHEIVSSDLILPEECVIELQKIQATLQEYLAKEMEARLKVRTNQIYYADTIKAELPIVIEEILLDENRNLTKIMNEISKDFLEQIRNCQRDTDNNGKSQLDFRILYMLEEKFQQNRILVLLSGATRQMVYLLSSLYKEAFSDTAAYTILEFDFSTFQEAFCISEGKDLNQSNSQAIQIIRETMMETLLENLTPKDYSEKLEEEAKAFGFQGNNTDVGTQKIYRRIIDHLYDYDCTRENLYNYMYTCKTEMEKHFDSVSQIKMNVKKFFSIFSNLKNTGIKGIEIYREIEKQNVDYRKYVDELLSKSF